MTVSFHQLVELRTLEWKQRQNSTHILVCNLRYRRVFHATITDTPLLEKRRDSFWEGDLLGSEMSCVKVLKLTIAKREQGKFELEMDVYRLMIRCDNYIVTNSNQLVLMGFNTADIKQAEPQCQRITRHTWSWKCSVLERNLEHTTKHVCHSLHYVVVCRYIPCGWWNVLKMNRENYYNLILCEVCTQLLRKTFPSTIIIKLLAYGIFLNIV